jgi:thiol-disulfide isomerase/thioredoxin
MVIQIKKIISSIVIILLSLVLTGCSEPNNDGDNTGNAPDFTLTTINGETFTLSDNFGKVILLDFMAIWCGYCYPQMDELNAILGDFEDEILIVSVDVDKSETSDQIKNAFSDYVNKWIFVMDNYEENAANKYQVTGIPKLVIIDKDGNVYYSHSGLTSKNTLTGLINEIIGGK